jgi:tetratricopeptide (TPR) repeat protein
MLTDTAATLMAEAAHLRRQNRIAEAIAAYRTIVMRFPKFADAWYNLAVLQRNTFQFDQALRSYDEALAAGITRPPQPRRHIQRFPT